MWHPEGVTTSVTNIPGGQLQRIRVEDTESILTQAQRLGRVRVTYSGP